MLEVKVYVIGVIEIDPVPHSPDPWVSPASTDDTLEAVLARLAGRLGGGELPTPPPCSSPKSQRVIANLAGLSADLTLHLAEMRARLQAATTSSG